MNIRFLVLSSFLIALLFHVAFFSGVTLVFPIDPESPKPKFFFLGPILTQKEVSLNASDAPIIDIRTAKREIVAATDSIQGEIKEDGNQEKNPFLIRTISKPLAPHTDKTEEKTIIKSTFETEFASDKNREKDPDPEPELNIQPYQSLRFRAPSPNDLK